MRIFLTGANGYLGGWTIHKLEEFGHTVLGMDSHHCLHHLTKGEAWEVNQKSGITSIECVIALGWYSSVGNKHPHLQEESANNVKSIVNRLVSDGKKGVRFIFPSSACVYGHTGDNIVTEDNFTNPLCEYSKRKCEVETFIKKNLSNYVILRFGSMMGLGIPGLRTKTELVVNAFASDGYIKKRITVWNPDDYKPLIHVKDAAEIIARAAMGVLPSGIFNACTQSVRAIEIARYAAQVTGASIEVIPSKDGISRSCLMSSTKLNEHLTRYEPTKYEQTIEEFSTYKPSPNDRNVPWRTVGEKRE